MAVHHFPVPSGESFPREERTNDMNFSPMDADLEDLLVGNLLSGVGTMQVTAELTEDLYGFALERSFEGVLFDYLCLN